MSTEDGLPITSTEEADVRVVVPPSVEEEVFEVQIMHPYKLPLGWRPASQPWRDRVGEVPESPFVKLLDSFNPMTNAAHDSMVDDAKETWRWSSSWEVEVSYTACDEDGWTYGLSIASMNNHLAEGTSRTKPRPYDFLRRRRWVRTRVKVTPHDPAADGRFYCILRLDSAFSHVVHGRATPLRQMHNLTFNNDDIAMEGWLGKYGSLAHNWRLRYFLLRRDTNTLVYLKDLSSLLQLGQVPITTHTAVEMLPSSSGKSKKQFAFEVVNGTHRCRLNAPNQLVKMQWINAIHNIMFKRQPPFALKCAAMHRLRPNYREDCVMPHFDALVALFETVRAFVLDACDDILDPSGAAAATNVLPPAGIDKALLPPTPSAALVAFRADVEARLDAIAAEKIHPVRHIALLSYLKISQVKEEVYQLCLDLVDSILSFQVSKSMVKLKRTGSDLRRSSIPQMWIDEAAQDKQQRLSISEDSMSTCEMAVALMDEPPTSTTQPSSSTSSNVTASGAGRIKMGRKFVKQALRRVFRRAEHLDRGVDGLVVWANDKDIGSLIAYTLVSSMYVDRLEESCGVINVLMELEDRMISRTRNIYKEIKSTSTHHLKCHVVLNQKPALKDSTSDVGDDDEIRSTTVTVYFATQFHCLRHVCKPGNLGYLNSVAKSASWETSGGKSGAFFSLSHDQQFVLKGVSATEFNMFVDFAPTYFKYMADVAEKGRASCLAKIFGAYKIQLPDQSKPMYVLVMECSLFGFTATQLYDLKGVKRNRGVDPDTPVTRKVLPDENFIDRMPVQVREGDLKRFRNALDHDVEFLASVGVIDYSLLLAFNDDTLEVRAALIDYVHQFDFIKRVESGAKKMYQLPTVLPPDQYKERFLHAMDIYFLSRQVEEGSDEESSFLTRCFSDNSQQQQQPQTTRAMRIRPRTMSDVSSKQHLLSIVE
ncbi:Aste57867_14378 [Aphanomyces stellatus]|uniref:Aste57867_14378 protein n=1 Tax=Aphanomyces stellatus TaxID=120398 RepID=A0A485L271_9STRA|nr:hypothetical protein As57867_014324 [Aphanomyces stellatus]VFT91201.1 Aste57867_14378 [Aphanomyces stellatus]